MGTKRIAILADFPWSYFDSGATGRGGGQGCTWLTQLAEEYAKQDRYEIHWVSLAGGLQGFKTLTREWGGQHFHRLPGLKRSIDIRLGFLTSAWQLRRILKRLQPDLVHCWGTETPYPTACGDTRFPVLLSMQGILTEYDRIGGLPDFSYWRRLVARERVALRRATAVTCESHWGIQKVLAEHPAARTYQVEYGVNPAFYQVAWEPDAERPYALFSGSMDWRKGVDVLVEAMRLLPERNWRLKLAGDGGMLEEIRALGLPGVECLGLLDWSRMRAELAGASCLVLPTRADTSPNVVKEARVVGLPVITTVHGGQAGYIRDGENGFIVNPLEPQGLAHALQKLMKDPELGRKMGNARHEEDRAYFLPSNTARGFVKVYDELLGNRTPLREEDRS
jgi:glycosyltransferase involved in cell wall biosynthesis